jgi:hypothetical protein
VDQPLNALARSLEFGGEYRHQPKPADYSLRARHVAARVTAAVDHRGCPTDLRGARVGRQKGTADSHWPNKNHVPAHMTMSTSSPRSRSSRSSSSKMPPTHKFPRPRLRHPLTFFHRTWQAPCSSKEGKLNEADVSYRFDRGEWSRGGVLSRRNQARPTQEALRSTPCSGQELQALVRCATRSTGSATNARAEPRHAQLRRSSPWVMDTR